MDDDYNSLETEYSSLNNWVESQIKDLSLIKEKMKVFKKNMITLREDICKIKEIPNGYFGFLNQIMKNFVKNITENLFQFDDLIITPLDNFLFSFKFATDKNINMLKEIKKILIEEKNELKNKRDVYFNYIINNQEENSEKNKNIFLKILSGGNDDNVTQKKDINIFNKSVEDNYEQLYQYELDKMNELIDENNLKYNNIYNEINAIFASYKLTVKESLIKFAKNVSNISLNFNMLSLEIQTKIDSLKVLKNEEIFDYINKISKTENEPRFSKEVKEKKETKKVQKNSKKNLFNFFSNYNNNINYNNTNNNEINVIDTEKKKEEKKIFIDMISNKLMKLEDIKFKEINELLDILS